MSRNDKILIVDDELHIRELLSQILKEDFNALDFAEDGEEACQKLEKTNYDLVLTDLAMPKVDGLAVLKKAREQYDDIIVIIMTGRASLEAAIEAVNLGADQFITKPFDVQHLYHLVTIHLDKQKLFRENIRLHLQTERDRDLLKKNLVELSNIFNFTKNLAYNFDVTEVYASIFESISEAVHIDFCSILDIRRKTITVKSSRKLGQNTLEQLKEILLTKAGASLDGKSITFEFRFENEELVFDEAISESYTVQLKGSLGVFGVLSVGRYLQSSFSLEDKQFIEKLSQQGETLFNQLQHVVRSQKTKMQLIIEDLPDGIIVYDLQDSSIQVNKAANDLFSDAGLTEIDKAHIEGFLKLDFKNIYDRLKLQHGTFIQEFTLDRKDNKTTVVDAHVANLLANDGMSQGIMMVLRDVTREREVERLKSEFISNVSHELRTPVATLKEFASIIKDGIAGPVSKTQMDYLNIMSHNLERLNNIINNLLNMSLIEAGIMKLRNSYFNLHDLIENVVRSAEVHYKKKNIDLKLEIQEDIDEIYADPDAITQILLNCFDNAQKFSENGSTVILKVRSNGSSLELEVQDSGRGISKKDLPKIFNRFYRIEDNERAREDGSGLGLSIIKEFVDLHGGSVKVTSELNKGTTIHINIPLQMKQENAEVIL